MAHCKIKGLGISWREIRHVSALANVDPRTVAQFLNGSVETRPAIALQIATAIKTIGRADVLPAQAVSLPVVQP